MVLLSVKSYSQASLYDPTFKVGHGANGNVCSIVIQDVGKIVVDGEFTEIVWPVLDTLRIFVGGKKQY